MEVNGWDIKKEIHQAPQNSWLQLPLRAGRLFFAILTIGATFLAYVVFIPKLTMEPGISLNPKLPFETRFIFQNQSFFSLTQVGYYDLWIEGKRNPQSPNIVLSGICFQVLETLKPDAKYSMRIISGKLGAQPIIPVSKSAIMTITVIYNYLYFLKHREKTFMFFTKEDQEGNYQWFPAEGDVPAHGIWNTNNLPVLEDQ
jgi:hypothetical protein